MATKDPKGLVTNEYLDDAVDTVLKGMDKINDNFRREVRAGFGKMDQRFNKVETELSGIKDDVKGLKADLSDTVSRKDFTHLKVKVDRFITS